MNISILSRLSRRFCPNPHTHSIKCNGRGKAYFEIYSHPAFDGPDDNSRIVWRVIKQRGNNAPTVSGHYKSLRAAIKASKITIGQLLN